MKVHGSFIEQVDILIRDQPHIYCISFARHHTAFRVADNSRKHIQCKHRQLSMNAVQNIPQV